METDPTDGEEPGTGVLAAGVPVVVGATGGAVAAGAAAKAGRAAVAAVAAGEVEVLLAVFKGIAGSVVPILHDTGNPFWPALARSQSRCATHTSSG